MLAADIPQIQHLARLAVLAMCARGVAAAEFEASPETQEIRFTVGRNGASELPIDVEYLGAHSMPIGGESL